MLSSVLTCGNLPLISDFFNLYDLGVILGLFSSQNPYKFSIKKHPYRIANRGAIMEYFCAVN